MRYDYGILIPIDTTEVVPIKYRVPLVLGELVKVSVYFPWGCGALAGVRILHYDHQLYPSNTGEWFTGNDIQIEFRCAYPIEEGRNHFYVEAYNQDNFYTHTPIVSFDILPMGTVLVTSQPWIEG